jgi:hypothetical protein
MASNDWVLTCYKVLRIDVSNDKKINRPLEDNPWFLSNCLFIAETNEVYVIEVYDNDELVFTRKVGELR